MKLATKIVAAVGLAALISNQALLAGDGKTFKDKVPVVEETKWWSAALTTGWDSLYMFRGVNVLRYDQDGQKQKYGSSLYWTDLNATWNISKNDFLTVGSWMAFGLGHTNYKELDLYANYTHTFGDLSVSLGYTFYYYLASNLYQNELNAKVAYTFHLPAGITLVPSLTYFFNVGPDFDNYKRWTGAVETCSSYLYARLDANIPVYKDIVSIAPWFGFGTSFDFNAKTDSSPQGYDFFTGANNIEMGIGIPVKLNSVITVYGYGAYSYQWYGLVGTNPSTFYGGAKVTFSF